MSLFVDIQSPFKSLALLCLLLLIVSCGGGGGGGSDDSSNANLSDLSISVAALDQTFQSSVTVYSASVGNAVASTTVTPTQQDVNASITVNGVAVVSGVASAAIALSAGDNDINVVVTAEDGSTQKTYTITITRESAFSNRIEEPVVFIADRETDGVSELYAAFDDGSSGEPIKLSEPLVSSGQVIEFSMSPDKAFIAYLADQEVDQKVELYVLPVDANDANYKTSSAYKVSGVLGSQADVRSFAWSPDSSRLVFLADADIDEVDELYMVDTDSNNLHKISGDVSSTVEIGDYAWSPDSLYVAYKVYNRHFPKQVVGVNSHDSRVNSGLGFSVRLNPELVGGKYIKSFAWSPPRPSFPFDPPNLAYLADQDVLGQYELYRSVASVSDASIKINLALSGTESVTDFAWAPNGENIAFLAGASGAIALYSRTSTFGPPAILLSDTLHVLSFEWSSDSQRIAMIGSGSQRELFFTTLTLAPPVQLSSPLVTGGNVKRFLWSPDSSTVAYLADQDIDEVFELYISTWIGGITGDKVSGLLVAEGDVQAFAWSPDSSMLAYRADAKTAGVDALFSSHVDGDWIGRLLSSSSPPDGIDTGVFSFSWAEDSGALSYHAADTTEAVVELYASLADGGVTGSVLSGTLVDDGDVSIHYAYENSGRSMLTRQTRITNLFKDGFFIEPGTSSELCGIVYDPAGDAVLINKCVGTGNSKILKYSFDSNSLSLVFEYDSQLDYGLRLFDDELWMVRTYDKGFKRFTDLQDSPLTESGNPFEGSALGELNEIYDLTLSEGDLYIVAGNPLGSPQHNGIQRIDGPAFNTITELVNDVTAAWPNESFVYNRSIISVGTGVDARLIAATGPGGDVERWDLAGNFINSVTGFGQSYLQKDSQEKIYTLFTNVGNSSVTRWASDLGMQETIPFTSVLNSGDRTRYVLREGDTDIDIIMATFRSRDPRFDSFTVMK